MKRSSNANEERNNRESMIRKARLLSSLSKAMAVFGFLSLVLPLIFMLVMAGYYPSNSAMVLAALGAMAIGTTVGFLGYIMLQIDSEVMAAGVFFLDHQLSPLSQRDDGSCNNGGSGGSSGGNVDSCTKATGVNEGSLTCDGTSVSTKCETFVALVKREACDLGNEIASKANSAVDELAYAMFGGMKQEQLDLAFATATQEGGGIYG